MNRNLKSMQSDSPSSGRKALWNNLGFMWLAVMALACLVYWVGLSGPLVFDDTENLAPINAWLHGDKGWRSVIWAGAQNSIGRPVSMGSFMLNVLLLGPNIFGFKLVNLMLHLLNGTLVYLLFRRFAALGGLLSTPLPSAGRWLALLAASLWLLHPLLVSTVLYVVQRMAMLSALFSFVAMLAYLQGRIALQAGARRKATAWFALVLLAIVLAMLSKENGVLALPLCAVIELVLFAPAPGTRRPRLSSAFLFVGLVLPAMAAVVLTLSNNAMLVGGYANRGFTLTERLMTQSRVMWDYVSSLALPFGPRLGLYHDDYVISRGLLAPATTSLAIAAWVGVVLVAWRTRDSIPGLLLGLAIFLAGHALESSVPPLLIYFEHRNYLPAMGALWALVSVSAWLGLCAGTRMHHGRGIFIGTGILFIAIFALATAARAGIWQSMPSLLAQAIAYHPDSRWARTDAAKWAMEQQPPRIAEARAHIEHLAGLPDESTRRGAGIMSVIMHCETGQPVRPIDVTHAFGGRLQYLEADSLLGFERLAVLSRDGKCLGLTGVQAADQLSALVDRSGTKGREYNLRRLRFSAARIYAKYGALASALVQARKAYDERDKEAPIPAFVAQLEMAQGNYAEASRMLALASALAAKDDVLGREVIAGLQAQLRELQQATLEPPRK